MACVLMAVVMSTETWDEVSRILPIFERPICVVRMLACYKDEREKN